MSAVLVVQELALRYGILWLSMDAYLYFFWLFGWHDHFPILLPIWCNLLSYLRACNSNSHQVMFDSVSYRALKKIDSYHEVINYKNTPIFFNYNINCTN